MADQTIELKVKINSETGGLEIAESKIKHLGDSVKTTGDKVSDFSGSFGDLAKQFLPFVTVVGGATFAISKLTNFVSDSIKESEDFRQVLVRVRSAIETTGGSWEKSGKAVEEWANALQRSTRFSDTQAISALDALTRATGSLEIAQKASVLAMDISVRTGKEFASTLDLVKRLILGQNLSLREAQREFGNVLSGAEDTKEALKRLALAYEGAALAEKSLTSETSKLKNEWEDLKKNLGNAITPALLTLTETLNNLFPSLAKVGVVLKSYFTKGAIATAVDFKDITGAFSKIDEEAKKAAESVDKLRSSSGGLAGALAGYVPPKIGPEDDGEKGGKSKEEKQEMLGPSREDFEKYQGDVSASNERLLAMEDDLNVRLAQLNDGSIESKRNALIAERDAFISKVEKEIGSEQNKEKNIAQIRAIYRKKEEIALKSDAKLKTQLAMQTADIAIQALQTIDGMGEINSANDARRAKLFLALRQSMAIANAWVSALDPSTPGPLPAKVGLAAATTGLILAQFAAQSKAIDKARAANNQEKISTSISTDFGNETVTETFGSGSTGDAGSGTNDTRTGGWAAGGGGGGGAGTVINIGPTTVHFSADSVDVNNIDMIARRIGDAVSRGNVEAAQMALALYRSGQKQEGMAR